MIALHSSAVDALRRQDEERRAREDRMRNALEILASPDAHDSFPHKTFARFVRATAREGLGREAE
jgi:hypothetical protein